MCFANQQTNVSGILSPPRNPRNLFDGCEKRLRKIFGQMLGIYTNKRWLAECWEDSHCWNSKIAYVNKKTTKCSCFAQRESLNKNIWTEAPKQMESEGVVCTESQHGINNLQSNTLFNKRETRRFVHANWETKILVLSNYNKTCARRFCPMISERDPRISRWALLIGFGIREWIITGTKLHELPTKSAVCFCRIKFWL